MMREMRHGGDIYRNVVREDFSINVNPLGMPESVKQTLKDTVELWSCYPDTECQTLCRDISEKESIKPEMILCGNGAAELIYELMQVKKPRRILLIAPSFCEYEAAANTVACACSYYVLDEQDDFRIHIEALLTCITEDIDMVFLCNPNNPNGLAVSAQEVLRLADACAKNGAMLVVDECFIELMQEPEKYSVLAACENHPELFVLRAFTKTYAMAGLRLGYAVSADLELLKRMKLMRQPWNVSVPAQMAGSAALKEKQYLYNARMLIKTERERMKKELENIGNEAGIKEWKVYSSQVNYLLFFCERKDLKDRCLKEGILIRDCSDYRGLTAGFYRVCVKTPEENDRLLNVLRRCMQR